MSNTYKNQTFLLLAHYATFAFQDLLFDYLTNSKAFMVTKINFPLPELPYLKNIEIQTSKSGTKFQPEQISTFSNPPSLAYLLQSIQLMWLSIFSLKKYDVVIAQDSLLANISIFMKSLGKCKKIVYYCHGLDPTRFSNLYLNRVYQFLDSNAAKHADYNWILSASMLPVRSKQHIPLTNLFHVPASIPVSAIKRKNKSTGNRLIFIGVLDDRNGVLLLPDIIDRINKSIPDVKLDIIGDGPLKDDLLKEITSFNLDKKIRVLGLKKFSEYSNSLTDYALGLAPYCSALDNLTTKTDPMKIRIYEAAGVPVVTTKGFHFCEEIENYGSGVCVNFNSKSYAKICVSLLKNKGTLQTMRLKALEHSKELDIDNIYRKTFSQILLNL